MSKKTKVFTEQFGSHSIFAVWEVDPCGNQVGSKPVISFGVAKATAILRHLPEMLKFFGLNINQFLS